MPHDVVQDGIAEPPELPAAEPSRALSALLRELATLPERGAWQRGCRAGETVGRFELLREIGPARPDAGAPPGRRAPRPNLAQRAVHPARGPPRRCARGAAHAALGQAPEARAAWSEALPGLERHTAEARAARDAPSLAVQLFWLARAHAGVGRGEEALREAREAQALVPDLPQRAMNGLDVAEIAAGAGRRDGAVRVLRQVLASPYGLYTAASLRAMPGLATLRGDPGFEALVGPAPAR